MMRFRSRAEVVVWAPAKVNLFLEVLGKRPDGYHELATLMVAVRLFDTLVLSPRDDDRLELHCRHAGLSTGPDNLVLRAARLVRERTGCQRGCSIRLVKRIPLAAGLAGGSSDAAATLAGLNDLWQLDLSDAELARLGAELGSDIPFFFQTPAAWCTGRGEIVTPAPVGQALDLVLVCPPFGLATADVYRQVRVPAEPQSGDALRAAVATGAPGAIGPLLFNRLEEAAARVTGDLADYQRRLADLNPAGHLMSGSGSTLFALARSPAQAKSIARAWKTVPGVKTFLVRSCV